MVTDGQTDRRMRRYDTIR